MARHPQVAFVGLGAIGLPMAESIVRAGLPLVGVEPVSAGRERAEAAGVRAVADIADAGDVEVVVVMVATGAQLAAVVDAALAADAAAGRTWIISATVGPDVVRAEAARLEAAGAAVVDAPVSGGVARAGRGDLVLFASGSPAALADAAPVLDALGTARVVGGRVGEGQAVKVVNQHLAAVHIVAAAEALALAERLDLDPAFVLDVVGGGAAASFMLGDRGPRMLAGEDAPVLSQVGIFVKDTGLVAEAAEAAGIDLPVLRSARERFLAAEARGLGRRDDSSVIETYREGSAS
ncbi:NAD(P)-dependent oxidoreductase [Microbacterium sp. zg.Y1090]|uniref:NAD(P)-dependent oxidoreductase n=1 Tax=Microbacterium TaxID=33882 RepID=UPI00214AF61C|nr:MULTISPECIES: NAD(P)-dependent oxidoreductase [unclassified Microbacterium]MCR2813779.1 NAD(P)-dependent oxidoreductase [Microbacterium sp. zg.Y1084]MCR2819707.1 NAD(P)-dependent oxidoreductase [Microbacterium sp. zg.Y1090]MDL5487555.1 NAD(P)-dependent oxidoreductase [Microbacterium sp. zg-Y1211]WIM28049.1 NAD(P)-dependent oxidoreductase [Microbacterium sp. zg-Y1090]